jgi:hypothetical protein
MRRLSVFVAVLERVTACGGGAGEVTTGPDATATAVAATASSTTSTSSTTTTLAPTTTSTLPMTPTTQLGASARTPLLDEVEAAGWVEYADPVGWSIWLPPEWTVDTTDPGAIISAPDLTVIGVLPFDDTSDSVDSEDYLILSLASAGASGLIVNIDFSADDIILDVNQDGDLGSYDVWGRRRCSQWTRLRALGSVGLLQSGSCSFRRRSNTRRHWSRCDYGNVSSVQGH